MQVAHRLFQSGNFLVLPLLRRFQLAGQLVPRLGKVAVVARPVDNDTLPQFQCAGGDVVQKIAVVGHDEHRAPEGFQIGFQPFDGVHVQMVGGLVQQQQVGARQHKPGQIDPGLFAARQAHERPLLHGRVNFQAAGHPVIGHLQVVAAAVLKGGLQTAVPIEIHILPVGHQRLHAAHFLGHTFQIGEGLPQHLPDGSIGIIHRQLFQQTQSGSLVDNHVAAVIVLQPCQNLQQGGFSAAVGANDGRTLAGLQVKGKPLEDMVLSEVFMKFLYADLCHL